MTTQNNTTGTPPKTPAPPATRNNQAPQVYVPEQFNFFNPEHFQAMQRVCTMFANSELVPDRYRISDKNPKERAIANCMIAIEMATRIGASPLMVMQNMYVVYGTPGWSSKFLIATVNSCGRFESLDYEMKSLGVIKHKGVDMDNVQCIAFTTELRSSKILKSAPVTMKMALEEGWYEKNGSKWKTMPELMLQYRAAAFWTRTHAPELSMGMKTADEIEDIGEEIPYEDVSSRAAKNISDNANKSPIGFDTPTPPIGDNGGAASEATEKKDETPSGQGVVPAAEKKPPF